MAVINLDELLSPLSEDQPCGPVCEYEPAFMALEEAGRSKPERYVDENTTIPGEEPVWRDVAGLADELTGQTKDLRIALLQARAATNIDGVTGMAAGLALLHGLLSQFWDDVHPELDEEDDNDPTMRMNALVGMNDRDLLVKDVLAAPLVEERQLGKFSMRDIRLSKGELEPVGDEVRPDPAHIDAAFVGAELDELQTSADAAAQALTSFEEINALLMDKVGGLGPELDNLGSELKAINAVFGEQLSRRGVADPDEADAAEESGAGTAGASGSGSAAASLTGEVRSRDDAIRALDKICMYYRANEPSSPVPLLLERAKRLISKDFMEILRDMTPAGVAEALLLGGVSEEEYNASSSGGSAEEDASSESSSW